jgi:hypothetical protein
MGSVTSMHTTILVLHVLPVIFTQTLNLLDGDRTSCFLSAYYALKVDQGCQEAIDDMTASAVRNKD